MASELVRNVWCDVHAEDTDTRVPVSAEGAGIALQVGKIVVTVDLCEDCIANRLMPMAEFAETYGRAESAPANGAAAPAKVGPLICPDCGKSYQYRNSLATHMRDVHRTVLPRLRAAVTPATCPHCGVSYGGNQGLASHMRSAHPDKWTGKVPT